MSVNDQERIDYLRSLSKDKQRWPHVYGNEDIDAVLRRLAALEAENERLHALVHKATTAAGFARIVELREERDQLREQLSSRTEELAQAQEDVRALAAAGQLIAALEDQATSSSPPSS